MAFINSPRFPIDLNYGSMGGPVFKTDIVVYGDGSEYRNSLWSTPRNRYDVRYAVRSRSDLLNVYQFFMALKGSANGFRIRDLFDFTSAFDGKSAHAADDVTIGVGDGVEVDFQLFKRYSKGSTFSDKQILKPVTGTVLIEVNGAPLVEGVGFTVDTGTGLVSLTVAAGAGQLVTAGFEFDIPVRFESDDLSHVQLLLYTENGSDLASLESIPLIEVRE